MKPLGFYGAVRGYYVYTVSGESGARHVVSHYPSIEQASREAALESRRRGFPSVFVSDGDPNERGTLSFYTIS